MSESASDIRLHRVRFYPSDFYTINCIAYNEKKAKVALLRRRARKHRPSQSEQESLIEIWNMQHKALFLEQTIFDDSDNLGLLESLVWSEDGRLFSCGLNGYVNEYDLVNSCIKQSHSVNSSPAWCVTIQDANQLIAVGTEDGFICVFKLYESYIEYDKVMDKTDNRIICLDWFVNKAQNSILLIGGSIDYIKIWNYQSGKCVDSIKVGNTKLVIWTLKVLSDFTIISGDSNGTLSFWNGSTTTLNVAFTTPTKADILSVCVSKKENFVYAACVDSVIVQYNRDSNRKGNWIKAIIRRQHTHDVRALCYVRPSRLLSGGVDTLFMQTFLKRSPRTNDVYASYLPNISRKISVVCRPDVGNYVGLQFGRFFQIWKLGNAQEDSGHDHFTPNSVKVTQLDLIDNARKLVQLFSRKMILCSAMDKRWLVYANYSNLKVFTWDEDKVEKVKLFNDPTCAASQIVLTNNNRMFVSHGRTLECFKLDKLGVVVEHTATLQARIANMCTAPHKLIVSLDDENNSINVYNIDNHELLSTLACPLPPTALSINRYASPARLVLALPNCTLLEHNLESLQLINSHNLSELKSNETKECKDFNENWPIKQIAFSKGMILLSDDNSLYALNFKTSKLTKCEGYRHVIAMDNFNHTELVVVEVTPDMIFSALPPAVKVKTFGT